MTMAFSPWFNGLKILKISKTAIRTVQSTDFGRKLLGYTSLGFALAKCDSILDSETLKKDSLTPEQCIRQACLLSVNSASTLLTTTSAALLDVCKNYKDSLDKILSLLQEILTLEGENPALWDAVVEARLRVNKAKSTLNELNSYMETVEKVVKSTTEATFLAGAEYMCTALCERLYSAQKEIANQIAELRNLEEEYLRMQHEVVTNKEKGGKHKIPTNKIPEIKKDTNLLKQ